MILERDIEKKLVNVNSINDFKLENVGIVGGKTGSGKSWYAIKKAIEAMQKDESILIFNTELTKNELSNRLITFLTDVEVFSKTIGKEIEDDGERAKEVEYFLHKSKSTIIYNEFEETLLVNKMKELSNSKYGLDLVIVDTLSAFTNTNDLFAMINRLEGLASELGCKIITLTQLNANANISSLNKIK